MSRFKGRQNSRVEDDQSLGDRSQKG